MPTECNTYCGGCDSCDSCDSCEGCISCEICDSCQGGCDTSEAFCVHDQNSHNGFTYSECISHGEIIGPGYFDQSTWNEAVSQIKSVFNEGAERNASSVANSVNYCSDKYLKASEFNRISNVVDCDTRVSAKTSIVYGSYFSSLENAVANLYYKDYQCDMCNQNCDNGCDACESCDASCNSCNSCDSCNSCEGCDNECDTYCCDCCDHNCCDNDTTTTT